MEWNAELYHAKHEFVAEYGQSLLAYVPNDPGQVILDIGCGTGTLTCQLVPKARKVIGIDYSADMVAKAKELCRTAGFIAMDACAMPWENYFDVVFSNAVFHWIRDHKLLLQNVRKVLKPQGRLICEFGAHGNIAAIQTAFETAMTASGQAFRNQFFFPTVAEYRILLANAGFEVEYIGDYDRPTPLADGPDGLKLWMRQFYANDLANMPGDSQRNEVILNTESALRPRLFHDGQWVADYRRLRLVAKSN